MSLAWTLQNVRSMALNMCDEDMVSHVPVRRQYLDFASCLFPEQKVFRHGFDVMDLFDGGVVDFRRCDFIVVD